jgi:ferredoxin-NADP reductase
VPQPKGPSVSNFEPGQFKDVQADINSKKKRQRSKEREPH